jgi:hypothetical protein
MDTYIQQSETQQHFLSKSRDLIRSRDHILLSGLWGKTVLDGLRAVGVLSGVRNGIALVIHIQFQQCLGRPGSGVRGHLGGRHGAFSHPGLPLAILRDVSEPSLLIRVLGVSDGGFGLGSGHGVPEFAIDRVR